MKPAILATAILFALSARAAAQDGVSAEDLLTIAKTTYPGELCWWDRAEEDLGEARSWTLTFRYDYEQNDGPDRTLILHQLPCFYGAYNFGSLWFTETEFEGLVPLHFAEPEVDIDYADEGQETISAIAVTGYTANATLINADFDEKTRTINSFSKWRGLGDAFSAGTWEFRSGRFVLTRYEVDPTYDGDMDPITVYADGN
ncbi:MAG: hypothetical protein Kow0026_03890 [Oricola sp.]